MIEKLFKRSSQLDWVARKLLCKLL